MEQYARLLLEWNRTVNLTGARTMDAVEAHIADAHRLLEVTWNGVTNVIDIGSGGGLPAVPLALRLPAGSAGRRGWEGGRSGRARRACGVARLRG